MEISFVEGKPVPCFWSFSRVGWFSMAFISKYYKEEYFGVAYSSTLHPHSDGCLLPNTVL